MPTELTAPLAPFRRSHDEMMRVAMLLHKMIKFSRDNPGFARAGEIQEMARELSVLQWCIGDSNSDFARWVSNREMRGVLRECCVDDEVALISGRLAREWSQRS